MFVKLLRFSEIFTIIFLIFNNYNADVGKSPQILGLRPGLIVKFVANIKNGTPQTFGKYPQSRNPACITAYCFIYIHK